MSAEKNTVEALRECEETLRHMQKMESIGQMSAGIAHDFNNLLQGIVASLELVRKLIATGRGAETERFIATAIKSAQRAAALNHRLMDFSGRKPLTPQTLKMNDLIVGMEDLLRRPLPATVKLEVRLAPDLWETHCDANQAENAVLNLVLNARDAIQQDGIIAIETRNTDIGSEAPAHPAGITTGQYVCIRVTDSGTGMSEEVIQHACDTWFTTKEKGLGIGLGLTMVERFVRLNNGGVKIDSEIGRGTSVSLYLPRW